MHMRFSSKHEIAGINRVFHLVILYIFSIHAYVMRLSAGTSKLAAVLALAVVIAFAAGLFVSPYFTNSGGSNNLRVGDSFSYGECLGCQSYTSGVGGTVNVVVNHMGKVVYDSNTPDRITNEGETVIARQTACGATSAPACANGGIYIALSTSVTATSGSDTTCPSELTTNGLARTLGTFASTGNNTDTISNTFTYSGASQVVITKVCMFDAASGGNLFAEDLLSSSATVSASGDQVTITWTFTH